MPRTRLLNVTLQSQKRKMGSGGSLSARSRSLYAGRRGRIPDEYVASMAVFALWSAPRARSTAFFRSMAERGDMTVLHEPFCNLRDYGETDAGGANVRFAPVTSRLAA